MLWHLMLRQVWTRALWSIRFQSPCEVRTQLRQSRRDLPWRADLSLQIAGKCVGRESWLHIKESVYSTCRFLGSCFLSDKNNKNNFRVFSSCMFFSILVMFRSQSTTGPSLQKGEGFEGFSFLFSFVAHAGTQEFLFVIGISLT